MDESQDKYADQKKWDQKRVYTVYSIYSKLEMKIHLYFLQIHCNIIYNSRDMGTT